MLNDLPDELENFGKDTEYATQPRGLGAHKKTIRIDDSSPQLMDYSDSEDGLPPSPKRLQLVDYSDTDEFDLILIWFNGTSAHMGHFSA